MARAQALRFSLLSFTHGPETCPNHSLFVARHEGISYPPLILDLDAFERNLDRMDASLYLP